MGKIIDLIYTSGFSINQLKMSKFTQAAAQEFYGEHKGKPFFDNLVQFVTSDVAIGLELVSDDAIKKWRSVLGPTNTQVILILIIDC
jgi:nucleoside-diphosphate kinase